MRQMMQKRRRRQRSISASHGVAASSLAAFTAAFVLTSSRQLHIHVHLPMMLLARTDADTVHSHVPAAPPNGMRRSHLQATPRSSPRDPSLATRNNRTTSAAMAAAATTTTTTTTTTTQSVPQKLFFTMSINSMLPPVVYGNVQNTIDTYRLAWGNPNASVAFLDDARCLEMIGALEPRLIVPFRNEKGAHKGDICRVAALYLEGGYYFDLDLKTIHAMILPQPSTGRDIGFVSVLEDKRVPPYHDNIFQAFLASRPRHPILQMALKLMVEYYEGTREILGINMGTSTMKMAIDAVSEEDRRDVKLLQEMQNLPKFDDWYPDLPPQKGVGCCCDFIVHDPDERNVFFWSHVPGWGENCMSEK